MQAILVNIKQYQFLLPERKADKRTYYFPRIFYENKTLIADLLHAAEQWQKKPLRELKVFLDESATDEINDFKNLTGIIGFPFNAHDVDLYRVNKNIDVVMEVDLSEVFVNT